MFEWNLYSQGKLLDQGTVGRIGKGHFKRVDSRLDFYAWLAKGRTGTMPLHIRPPKTEAEHELFRAWLMWLPHRYRRGALSVHVASRSMRIAANCGFEQGEGYADDATVRCVQRLFRDFARDESVERLPDCLARYAVRYMGGNVWVWR